MNSVNSLLETSSESLDLLDVTFGNVVSNEETQECYSVQNYDNDRKRLIDKVMNHYLRHNITLTCLEGLMDLLNDNREPCDKFPTSKKPIMKMFRGQRDLFDVFNFVKCNKCRHINKIASDISASSCVRCNIVLKTTETNFFVAIPIEQQIKKSVQENWSYIRNFTTSGNKDSPFYSDAHDGKILKDLLEQYADSEVNILSFVLNLDGANKYKSNTLSVWPIQLLQNYSPPSIRFLPKNIIVSGLYYHQEKPDCFEYMLPLITELNDLGKRKITMDIDGEEFTFKPVITHCSVDLPAKSLLQATKQFGGYEACKYCDIVGESIVIEKFSSCDDEKTVKKKKNVKANDSTAKKPTQFVRYTEDDQQCTLRDEVQTLKKMLEVLSSTSGEAVNGVKDVSCLVGLEHFNIVFSIGVDYMHDCLLGAQKRILNYFCNSKFKAQKYYIPPKGQASLSAKLLAIKPTANITLSRDLLTKGKISRPVNFDRSSYIICRCACRGPYQMSTLHTFAIGSCLYSAKNQHFVRRSGSSGNDVTPINAA